MPDIYEYEKVPPKPQVCPTIGNQSAVVCLPVAVSPYAVTGPIKIKCCGEPVVSSFCNRCRGKVNETCEFTISQKINVEIPVEFGATVNIGETFIECGCASADELPCEHGCNCCKEEA
jgi:hypothetical protein